MSEKSRLDLLKELPHDLRIEIIDNELRKEFTESEKAYIAEKLKPIFAKESNRGKRTDLETESKEISNVNHDADDKIDNTINKKIAKVLGNSKEQIRKREKVFDNIDPELRNKLDTGEKSLNSAYQETIQKANQLIPIPPMPLGKFNNIVTDPGWFFENQNIGGSGSSGASSKYLTQQTVDIAKIPIRSIAADNSILYMWTTNQHLITGSMLMSEYYEILNEQKIEVLEAKTVSIDKVQKLREQITTENATFADILKKQTVQSDALSVMHCYGFTPKGIITWEKQNKVGWGGFNFNNVTEQLIVGVRGKVAPFKLTEKTLVSSQWKKGTHSEKPAEMWDLIEKCVKTQRWNYKKIEFNCRTPREGWESHGNQLTPKDIDDFKNPKKTTDQKEVD